MMPVFRTATATDIPTLQSLAHAIWHEAYEGIISTDQIAYMLEMMYSESVIAQELAQGVRWEIIADDNEDCGFISYEFAANNEVKLSKIYVRKEARGSGIAATALHRVAAYAEENGRHSVFLTVNKQNQRAIRAYEKFGFRIADATVFAIGGGFMMDDYIMRRRIDKKDEQGESTV